MMSSAGFSSSERERERERECVCVWVWVWVWVCQLNSARIFKTMELVQLYSAQQQTDDS